MPTNSETISAAIPRLLRVEVFMRAQCRLTSRLTDPAPVRSSLQPRRNRGVRCSRFVRRQNHAGTESKRVLNVAPSDALKYTKNAVSKCWIIVQRSLHNHAARATVGFDGENQI